MNEQELYKDLTRSIMIQDCNAYRDVVVLINSENSLPDLNLVRIYLN